MLMLPCRYCLAFQAALPLAWRSVRHADYDADATPRRFDAAF